MENKDLCLVSCSSLIDLKRVDLIIDSLSLVDSVNIHWKHFGDGKNRQYLEVYAKEKLDSKNNITYVFEGHVNNNQINQFYAENKVDLLVNTSLYEGLPISMMEAMSHGIPCVGTNVGGVSEIIQDNFNGFLLPVTFEPGALANILINFAKLSKNEKQGFVQNAYNTWDEKFNGVKNISELELNLFKDSLDFTMIW